MGRTASTGGGHDRAMLRSAAEGREGQPSQIKTKTCVQMAMTRGDDRASLGSRAGLGHDPPENCTDVVPWEGGLQESLRYPSALKLRLILLASLGPRGSKITDIQTARNLRKSFNSLVLGVSKWA